MRRCRTCLSGVAGVVYITATVALARGAARRAGSPG